MDFIIAQLADNSGNIGKASALLYFNVTYLTYFWKKLRLKMSNS